MFFAEPKHIAEKSKGDSYFIQILSEPKHVQSILQCPHKKFFFLSKTRGKGSFESTIPRF